MLPVITTTPKKPIGLRLKGKKRKSDHLWRSQDKQRAVAAYASTTSFSKSSSITGIPENTIRYWATQDWFDEELRRADKTDSEELKGTFTRIAKRAASELEDRLDNGDDILTKDGDIVRKRIGGKDLAIIMGVATDKRKQQLDQPQTVATQSSHDKLLSLMESFIKFSQAKEIKSEAFDEREIQEIEVEVGKPQEGL